MRYLPAVVFAHVALALVEEGVGGADGRHAVAGGGAVRVAGLGALAVGIGRAHHALTARPHPELTHRPEKQEDVQSGVKLFLPELSQIG